ncbi:hypothetical protein BV20DRAFT_1054578 [Pilatotrama ljubarskyi]|nr:hypothetical protein BV20DRAFT_1054578 [Pilatotrama ljubarskyi]
MKEKASPTFAQLRWVDDDPAPGSMVEIYRIEFIASCATLIPPPSYSGLAANLQPILRFRTPPQPRGQLVQLR